MCKINGHSLFTYLAQPVWNTPKLLKSKERGNAIQEAENNAAETISKNTDGEEVSKTASAAQVNKNKKKQNISSLRVPLENSVGVSLGGKQALGLNLGG